MIAALSAWFRREFGRERRALLLGDLNVAPLATDVWNHRQLLRVVSHTPVEVRALAGLAASHRWVDAVRRFVPPSERLFSWWSYRAQDWAASDRGRRLDHVWVTPALVEQLRSASTLRAGVAGRSPRTTCRSRSTWRTAEQGPPQAPASAVATQSLCSARRKRAMQLTVPAVGVRPDEQPPSVAAVRTATGPMSLRWSNGTTAPRASVS